MPLFEWNDAYAVRIASIDAQHKLLVDLINQVDLAAKSGSARETLASVFAELVEYTALHFAWEERLFEKHGYPEGELHTQQHADLVEQVTQLRRRFEHDSGMVPGEDVLLFLTNWLVNHIQGSDMRYAHFLRSRGVK